MRNRQNSPLANTPRFIFGVRRANNLRRAVRKVNPGILALFSSVTNFVMQKKAMHIYTPANYWYKITDVRIVDSWVCVLFTRNTTDTEKLAIINEFIKAGFTYSDKKFEWNSFGYRQELRSAYMAIGPWTKKGKMFDPANNSRGKRSGMIKANI